MCCRGELIHPVLTTVTKALPLPVSHQISLTRSPPTRSADDQGEGFLLNSYDRTLVIKQITSEDVADMHNILSEYHQVSRRSQGLPAEESTLAKPWMNLLKVFFSLKYPHLTLALVKRVDPNGAIFRFARAAKWNIERDEGSSDARSMITGIL